MDTPDETAGSEPPAPVPDEPQTQGAPVGEGQRRAAIWIAVLAVLVMLFDPFGITDPDRTAETLSYSEFVDAIEAGEVASVEFAHDGGVSGHLVADHASGDGDDASTTDATPGGEPGETSDSTAAGADNDATTASETGPRFRSQLPAGLDPAPLLDQLAEAGVTVTATAEPSGTWLEILLTFLPIMLIAGVWIWFSRTAKKGMGGLLGGIGSSKPVVIDADRPSTRFADVAGYEGVKEELSEIVDFLKQPERFRSVGAIGPRGALMVGPPGTGKTLIARAVAGEADVPVLSVTGSAFVEMFVGVGAARVRDLFTEARSKAPAIIFVDEIDAIGQRRGGAGLVSNDEREQTLNQLLAEMDGFDPADGIVVLAATNRPDVLDPALLRPGRFDRQIVVPLPNVNEREAILTLHCANKDLADGLDLAEVSRSTPGFSGADLANLANEAAIFAVRGGRSTIERRDFWEARSRIVLGRRQGSHILLPTERRSIAVHEAGHALAAVHSEGADPVSNVTILPAGQSLGATEQLPLDERHLLTESHLLASLTVLLAGRSAELLVNGEASTGAANDLARATEIATRMVREFGLSPRLGPVGYPAGGSMYLGGEPVSTRTFSEATQGTIDTEVARLVGEAGTRATDLLERHRAQLDAIAERLLETETLDGSELYALLGETMPSAEGDRQTGNRRTGNPQAGHRKTAVSPG